MLDLNLTGPIVLAMFLASIVQGMAGFGFTLFALPILLLAGVALPQAVVVTVIGSLVQRGLVAYHLRDAIDWPTLKPMIAVGVAAVPVGIYCLGQVADASHTLAQQIVGAVVLALIVLQLAVPARRMKPPKRRYRYLAAGCSGFLDGFANVGGPPFMLWLMARNWPNEKTRVTYPMFSLTYSPFQLVLLVGRFGTDVLAAGGSALLGLPGVFVGSYLGLRLGAVLKQRPLRGVVYTLLTLAALSMIFRSVADTAS